MDKQTTAAMQALTPAIKEGDENAFKKLFEAYYAYLFKIAYQYLNDYELSEEVVQESFMKLWDGRHRLDPKMNIKYYLVQMIKNSCISHFDHIKVTMKYQNWAMGNLDTQDHDVNEKLIAHELQEEYERAIGELSTQCRHVFLLSRIEGLKYHEIAKKESISIKTVEQHMSKALKHLRSKLREYLPLAVLCLSSVVRWMMELNAK
ncbi:MAG: RNA polymerase sigma-70 factor [Bacteroidota bacterium]